MLLRTLLIVRTDLTDVTLISEDTCGDDEEDEEDVEDEGNEGDEGDEGDE